MDGEYDRFEDVAVNSLQSRSMRRGFWSVKWLSDFLRFQIYFWLGFIFCFSFMLIAFWSSLVAGLGMSLLMTAGYFVISLGLRVLYVKFQIKEIFKWRTLFCLLALTLIGAYFQMLGSDVGLDFFRELKLIPNEGVGKAVRIAFHWMVLGAWSLVYLGWMAEVAIREEEMRRLEALRAAERAELQMLRFQLNPHFMFNSLNNVITEIQDRPKVALEMTHRLASYLRYTLEYRGETVVPLSHEVRGIREYLEIEKDRFGEQLQLRVEIAEGLGVYKIPVFLLQPIFENAVKYGISSQEPPWLISLEIKSCESQVIIRVLSSGELVSAGDDSGGLGVGLEVVRRRLALHYPGRSEFDLSSGDGIVVAVIKLEGDPCQV